MLNFSGLNRFKGNGPLTGRSRQGLGALGAYNAASQMALLYPPTVDELVRREFDRLPTGDHRASGLR